MRDMKEIAWLAGLLEGEGCFREHKHSPGITLNSTDRDVVEHAADILGIPRPTKSWIQRPNRKPMWCVALHGAHAIAWMMTLYTFMGERRRARIRDLITGWTAHKHKSLRTTKGMRRMAKCHPEKRAHALLLCRKCYNQQNVDRYKKESRVDGPSTETQA